MTGASRHCPARSGLFEACGCGPRHHVDLLPAETTSCPLPVRRCVRAALGFSLAWCRPQKMKTLKRGLHDVRRASRRTPGRGDPARTRPPGAQSAWSLATSYKGRKVVFIGAGRTQVQGGRASAGRPLLAGRENPQRRSNTMELRTRTERSCSRPRWPRMKSTLRIQFTVQLKERM